jgi:hypothetical protein
MSSSPITALRLQLRAAGFPPLPCEGKKPAPKAWPKLNADDTNIKRWPQTFPAAVNTGVLCATVPCLDIDVLHPEAADAVEAMVRARFAERGQVLTRFGRRPKRCVLFRTYEPFKKITLLLIAPDDSEQRLEVLGAGQQAILFGIHPETKQPYTWSGGKPGDVARDALPEIDNVEAHELVREAAQLLIEKFGFKVVPREPEPQHDKQPPRAGNGPLPHGERYARAALDREAVKLAQVQPGGRNDALNVAALKCFGFVPACLTASEVSSALFKACEQNSLTEDDGPKSVRATLKSAYKSARRRQPPAHKPKPRAHTKTKTETKTETAGPKVDETHEEKQSGGETNEFDFGAQERLLVEMNRGNCVVPDGGKTWVLRFTVVERYIHCERYQCREPTFFHYQDFRHLYRNRYVTVGRNSIDLGRWWFEHANRRQYAGVAFLPAGPPIINGRLNLWRGWGVEPKQGDWSRLREHIFDVLAARDEEIDRYIISWLAWAVQHPDQQAEAALVLIGERGSGKGTLGNAMCRVFGQHAQHISSPDHLTGRFNHHLRACSLLFADEAYGPKDKSAEGTLKRLITEPTLTIEQKGHDVVEQPNLLHVMLASNNEWVVPAGAFERRFVVLRVAETHRQDREWFAPIYQQLKDGGYAAMLYDLLHRDLTDWHPREIVRTAELARQQEQSLSPLDEWWLELLQTGVLAGADPRDPSAAVSNSYEEEVINEYGTKRTRRRDGLYAQARSVSPRLKGVSDHKLGRYLRDQGCTNEWVRRRRGWQFPPLIDCRKKWEVRFPDMKWRDPTIEAWTCEQEE